MTDTTELIKELRNAAGCALPPWGVQHTLYEERLHYAIEAAADALSTSYRQGLEDAAKVAHTAHLRYVDVRDTRQRDTPEWELAQASVLASVSIWHAINALLPREANAPALKDNPNG